MSENVSLSQEQADMISAGLPVALELLMTTGIFLPTLYLHDGVEMTFHPLVVNGFEELLATAHKMVKQSQGTLAYALIYDSTVDTEAGSMDAVFIQTGDDEDEEAHEFFQHYKRETGFVAPRMAMLGSVANFLN
jgi:hypothetical protein